MSGKSFFGLPSGMLTVMGAIIVFAGAGATLAGVSMPIAFSIIILGITAAIFGVGLGTDEQEGAAAYGVMLLPIALFVGFFVFAQFVF